uniref:Uncharacterized protein n=1 Tax=Anguilla anguilla TaxID=7936 RepID=A0A0E9UJT8_ANGAN
MLKLESLFPLPPIPLPPPAPRI